MRILQIIDSPTWALGRIGECIRDNNTHMGIDHIYVHPREVEKEVSKVREVLATKKYDVIHFLYWRTASQLVALIPELKEYKTIVSHFNEKNLLSEDWSWATAITCCTETEKDTLDAVYGRVYKIYLGGDFDTFSWCPDRPKEKKFGYVGRIVPWKGLREIARAAYEIGYPLVVMGKMDKPGYWAEIPQEHIDNMDLTFFNCADEDRPQGYEDMTVFICNSGPNHESGPLPLLEAMITGVPVITTPCGIAKDIIEDQENGLIVQFNDYDGLKSQMRRLIEDEDMQKKLRDNGWKTAKSFDRRRMALEFGRLYHRIYSDKPLVSVIVPYTTKDGRNDNIGELIERIAASTYENLEIICVQDDDYDLARYAEYWPAVNHPVKVLKTGNTGYGLAQARNMAVVEANGKILVFIDSRLRPETDAIDKLANKLMSKGEKHWVFGEKGGHKATFVENFSAIYRDDFIKAGMCNERIDEYGGMSQELRERFTAQGFEFVYEPEAKAETIKKSSMTKERRQSIINMKLKLWRMGL